MTEPANLRTDGLCPAWEYGTLLGCDKQTHHRRGHRYRVRLTEPQPSPAVPHTIHPSIARAVERMRAANQ